MTVIGMTAAGGGVGLVRVISQVMTVDGGAVGDLDYQSPILRANIIIFRSDLHSLFLCLT
jgi:hypothetical protein